MRRRIFWETHSRRIVLSVAYLLLLSLVFMLPVEAPAQTPWTPDSAPASGPFRYFRVDGQCYALKPHRGPTQPMQLMAVTCTKQIVAKLGPVPKFE